MGDMNQMGDNDQIRPPDKVKRERLIDYSYEDNYEDEHNEFNNFDNFDNFHDEINKAINISLQEEETMQKIYLEYETKCLEEHLEMKKERHSKFEKLLNDLSRLSKYDQSIKEIYEIIEPIIYNFCNGYITFYEFDKETYDKIFHHINTIRTDKNAVLCLQEILKKEEK